MEPTVPTLAELLVGVEGLALLRTLYSDAAEARAARLAETRALLDGAGEASSYGSKVGVEYDIGEGYLHWSQNYDRPLRLFAIEQPPMLQLIDPLPAGVALDAACGTGRYAVHLHERGHTVIGVDQSPAMLALARAKLPGCTFLEGDLQDLPVDTGSIDAAVCALALVHVEDLDRAMAELARVLRPGGRLIISDVHPFLVMLGWQAQFTAGADRAFMRLHAHLPSAYCRAATQAGLVIRTCDEALLSGDNVATPTADLIPDANRQAYVGLPGVIVWEFQRPPGGRP